jgi:hypothetical protein
MIVAYRTGVNEIRDVDRTDGKSNPAYSNVLNLAISDAGTHLPVKEIVSCRSSAA